MVDRKEEGFCDELSLCRICAYRFSNVNDFEEYKIDGQLEESKCSEIFNNFAISDALRCHACFS